jgi:hypothetical protein
MCFQISFCLVLTNRSSLDITLATIFPEWILSTYLHKFAIFSWDYVIASYFRSFL